ncbi:hypothetical protein ALC56_09904 [Trachymyrmex septentrionalis]|uniref:Integrase zinc-binding domain-containing protein n=1 Tax=Trachymyrmex septentrionalis TaxID=34720 RepID=A0A151JTZ7_9HYME|nr:hypothetical protein ALC56_09904 [Trachymyrmex septentrionalis]
MQDVLNLTININKCNPMHVGSRFKVPRKITKFKCLNDVSINVYGIKGQKTLKFNNYNRKERVPFVIYADLECILEKTDRDQEHFIIKEIATAYEGNIDLLPITKEKYILYTKNVKDIAERSDSRNNIKLRFTDSYKFLSTNLDKVSESDYAHAMNIWQQFSVQTLSEYSDLYLKMVLLLVNIFEIFCDKCIESYGLDPAYYYTLLGFTWDAMLKHTLVNFELVSNFDVNAIAQDSLTDYVLEVHLEYPEHLHDKHVDLPFCPTHPLILLPESWLTHLIVESYHRRTLHKKAQLTLGMLRFRFWISRRRTVVKQWLHRCIRCTRWRTVMPLMSNLLQRRMTPTRPFLRTGVDYFGLILIPENKRRGYRVHRYLRVSDIFSNCGTNFIVTDRQLLHASSINGRSIAHAVSTEGILWEEAVKSTKYHLRRVISEAKFTFKKISTLLAQVEACLNSRPLHALSDDPDNIVSLIQKMCDYVWQKWLGEYLHTLTASPKWTKQEISPRIGSLSSLFFETTSPCRWSLVRIKLHPGDNGVIRVMTVTYLHYLIRTQPTSSQNAAG